MNSEDFFENLAQHLKNELPFVAYKTPNAVSVKAILQKDSELYLTKNFTEIGFIFAPFDDKENTVLIPLENSNTIECGQVISSAVEKSHLERRLINDYASDFGHQASNKKHLTSVTKHQTCEV